MTPIVYTQNETSFTSWGVAFLTDLVSCIVEEERNGDFILTAVLAYESPAYEHIKVDNIIYARCYDEEPIDGAGLCQPFRIYYISKPIDGKIMIKAEQIARAAMRRLVVKPFTGYRTMWSELQTAGATDHVGMNDTGYGSSYPRNIFPPLSVPLSGLDYMQGTEGSIVDNLHCEYAYNGYIVWICNERGEDRGVSIRYGVNLNDFNEEDDVINVYTGVLPYFYKDDGTYVAGNIVYGSHRSDYAEDRLMPLDLSGDYDTTPTAAQLTAKGQAYVQKEGFGEPLISFKIDLAPVWAAIDHGTDPKYTPAFSAVGLRLCDTAAIDFSRMGITATAKVVKTTYDVLRERYTTIELGNERPSLPRALVRIMKKTGVRIS